MLDVEDLRTFIEVVDAGGPGICRACPDPA